MLEKYYQDVVKEFAIIISQIYIYIYIYIANIAHCDIRLSADEGTLVMDSQLRKLSFSQQHKMVACCNILATKH